MNDANLLLLHSDGGMETAEFAFHVNRFRKPFDDISLRQPDADAVRVRIAVVDVDGIRALRGGRDAVTFPEDVGGDEQAIPRLMPVLVGTDGIIERDRRIGLLAFLDLQVQNIRLRQEIGRAHV